MRAARLDTPVRAAWRSAAWLASEKLLRLVLALGVGVLVARHLGPQEYGHLNLAMSWVGLLGSFAWFGVGDTLTRDMVRDRSQEGLLLGSALMLRTLGSLLALASIALALGLGLIPEGLAPLVWVLALGLPLAEITGGLWIWFQSHLRMARVVMVRQAALVAGAVARLAAVAAGGGTVMIAWTYVGEAAVAGLGLLWAWHRAGAGWRHWRFHLPHALQVFRTGLPVLLAAMVAALNARVDQLLLGALADAHAVGVYAAATRLSEIWWLVPTLLVQSFAPRFVFAPGLRPARVDRHVAAGVAVLGALALLPGVLLTLAGRPLADLLFGDAYAGAGAVLAVHAWVACFVSIDAAQNQWLLAHDRQAVLVRKSLAALVVHALAAAWLIPRFGAVGAAWSTLLAQAFACFGFYWLDAATGPGMRAVQRRSLRLLRAAPRLWRRVARHRIALRRAMSLPPDRHD